MQDTPQFIHLRCHSEHSLLEGAIPVKKLPALAAKHGMPAVALTDTNALFAALEFSVKAADEGVQPIVGCQVTLDAGAATGPVVLLAQNRDGWMNLMALSTCLYVVQGKAAPHITMDELAAHADGLICLTGGANGPLGQLVAAGKPGDASDHARALHAMFGDRLYVELQRHMQDNGQPMPSEAASEGGMIDIAYDLGIPLVATNDVYFIDPSMYGAHDALICIRERAMVDQPGPRRRLTRAALLQVGRGHGRAVRRPARGGGKYRRNRPPLRLCGQPAQADPAALCR